MAPRNRVADTHQRKPRCWAQSSHRGFTLLELMIAMAIMATALSVAWPLLRRPLLQSVSQEAAQQVIVALGQARATAIALGIPVQIYSPVISSRNSRSEFVYSRFYYLFSFRNF